MASARRGAGRWLPAALVAAVVAAGCAGGDSQSTTSSTPGAAASGTGGQRVELYFTAGEQFKKVTRTVPPAASPIEQAAKKVVEGAPPPKGDTNIPGGTELEDVDLSADGTAVVKVSADFLGGVPPEPAARSDEEQAELDARVAQVTYTLTQFDKVKRTKLVAGGVAVDPNADRAEFRPPQHGPDREPHPAAAAKTAAGALSTRQLQQRLASLRYLPRGAVDGAPGYRTEQAVVAFQAWEGLDRDGVVGPLTTAALADAKPPRPGSSGPSRRIEVYRDKGVALLIARGKVRRAVHVSSGGAGHTTPAGTFKVFRKELRSWSVPFQVWLPYASYFNQGIAFHEYPDVPPYPASHGCVRVPAPEAKGVYRFAKIGTTVVVL